MQKLKILNTREIKKVKQLLVKQFNCTLENEYAYLLNQKNRLFVVNKDIAKINIDNLRIDRYGLYFGELKDELRLSKAGAQLLVQEGKVENKVELSKEEVEHYFKGEDLDKDLGEKNKLIILSHENNILGCAKYKEHVILNFLPKIHRGTVIL